MFVEVLHSGFLQLCIVDFNQYIKLFILLYFSGFAR
jgi:hypothetical protein